MVISIETATVADCVRSDGFAHIGTIFPGVDSDAAQSFRQTWDGMALDKGFESYTQRFRSSTRYAYRDGELELCEMQAFIRRVEYDVLDYTGKEIPKPVALPAAAPGFLNHPLTAHVLGHNLAVVDELRSDTSPLEVAVHQFRVQARGSSPSPTTSGIHQDGYRWIFMHFIQARDCEPVVSTLYRTTEADSEFFREPMQTFGETLVVNDIDLHHAASEVRPLSDQVAYRDLLLMTVGDPNGPL